MKGDRAKLRLRLTEIVKKYDDFKRYDESLAHMQSLRVYFNYNEICAALSALNMMEEYREEFKVV